MSVARVSDVERLLSRYAKNRALGPDTTLEELGLPVMYWCPCSCATAIARPADLRAEAVQSMYLPQYA
jgi:hypothetical protein